MTPLVSTCFETKTPCFLLVNVDTELKEIAQGRVILFLDGVSKIRHKDMPPHLTQMEVFEP